MHRSPLIGLFSCLGALVYVGCAGSEPEAGGSGGASDAGIAKLGVSGTKAANGDYGRGGSSSFGGVDAAFANSALGGQTGAWAMDGSGASAAAGGHNGADGIPSDGGQID